jgi:lysophospholipase L1-like esterase
MTRPRSTLLALTASLLLLGCGSSPSSHNTGGSGGTGTGGNGSGGSGGSGGSTGGGGSGGSGSGSLPSGVQLGTYIVLGDSISANGGTGPFFYDSLHTDLTAKFPSLMYVHAAQGGAITDAYQNEFSLAPTLAKQIAGLGSNYPGDILVTITIGGNDLQTHAAQAIAGTDMALRTQFAAHLDAELGALAAPGRLGSGKVYIVLANIYDFTDGMGDFDKVMCGPKASVSPSYDQMAFANWNGISAAAAAKVNGAIYDMHADFMGHGYNNTDASQIWYDRASCIHPNAAGHDAIRRSIYKIVTGETLP